ncbi:hypothetical protein Celaphus_00012650, partial [Cervus elaphus hippelaphus]
MCWYTSAWHRVRRWDRAGRTKADRSAWEGLNPELGKRRATTSTLLDGLPASKMTRRSEEIRRDSEQGPGKRELQ